MVDIAQSLHDFLDAHPSSSLVEDENTTGAFLLKRPWGDNSFDLLLVDPPEKFLEMLNGVILPERFTAVYHKSLRQFEIIFTAYAVDPSIRKRDFEIYHRGEKHRCYFDRASDCVLSIAEKFFPTGSATPTEFRNLGSFRAYVFKDELPEEIRSALQEPVSFWVDSVEWEEDSVLDLINHLNFYMHFYDPGSPRIVVHSPAAESEFRRPRQSEPLGFPSVIVARPLDDFLLHFWYAAQAGDPARRFLYNYQILEYAAYYHIEEDIKKRIARELASPNVLSNLPAVVEEIVDISSQSKMHEIHKMEALLKQTVKPERLWREISGSREYFSSQVSFEGGFIVQPIVKSSWTIADFEVNGISSVSGTLRSIRNALSHGKEQRMAAVITPTKGNLDKLRHWVPLVAAAASEVMVYRDAL